MNNVSVLSTKSKENVWLMWVLPVVVALVSVFLVRTFWFKPFTVSGSSMQPYLQDGDKLFVNRTVTEAEQLKPGDIVVFTMPDDNTYAVKRVIALPGDVVHVKEGKVYVNGEELKESYLPVEYDNGDLSPQTVGDNQVYVLGDNRPESRDSRLIGPVSEQNLMGRAEFTFWPLNRIKWH